MDYVFINVKFDDQDSVKSFSETYDLGGSRDNYAIGKIPIGDIPNIIDDLDRIYEINEFKIFLK